MRRAAIAWLLAALLLGGCTTGLRIDTSHVSQNQDSRAQFLVLHYTVLDFEESLKVLTSGGRVSSHYLVRDEPPTIYRLVPDERRAWHAGPSNWGTFGNLNAASIGIEIVNPGWRDTPAGRVYAPFPPAQIDAVIALVKDIVARHAIRPDRIVGHNDIAPGRKQDPGPMFPWQRLADEGLIGWPDAAQVAARRAELAAAPLPEPRWFQERLARIGYLIAPTNVLDSTTRNVLATFQMKYRPGDIAGLPDVETAALLDVVTRPGGLRFSGRDVRAAPRELPDDAAR